MKVPTIMIIKQTITLCTCEISQTLDKIECTMKFHVCNPLVGLTIDKRMNVKCAKTSTKNKYADEVNIKAIQFHAQCCY